MSAKRTLLLYTGGTLGMKVDSMGRLFPAPGFLADSLNRMDELKSQNFPSWTLLEYDPLVDSSTFTAENWVAIAKDIEKHYDDFDGFVILTGTDTMAYTASALSFMITGLSKPVVFTGSQIPMERPFNDARRNLITSILISVDDRTPNEVCLFFNDSLLRGNRAIKISSNGLDAFSSPSCKCHTHHEDAVMSSKQCAHRPILMFLSRLFSPDPAFARLSAFHLKYNHDQYWLDEREGSRFFHSFEVDINPEESRLKICTQADADIAVICMTPTYRYHGSICEHYYSELFFAGLAALDGIIPPSNPSLSHESMKWYAEIVHSWLSYLLQRFGELFYSYMVRKYLLALSKS